MSRKGRSKRNQKLTAEEQRARCPVCGYRPCGTACRLGIRSEMELRHLTQLLDAPRWKRR